VGWECSREDGGGFGEVVERGSVRRCKNGKVKT